MNYCCYYLGPGFSPSHVFTAVSLIYYVCCFPSEDLMDPLETFLVCWCGLCLFYFVVFLAQQRFETVITSLLCASIETGWGKGVARGWRRVAVCHATLLLHTRGLHGSTSLLRWLSFPLVHVCELISVLTAGEPAAQRVTDWETGRTWRRRGVAVRGSASSSHLLVFCCWVGVRPRWVVKWP